MALTSVLSKRVTRTGAFCGMLTGFTVCFAMKLYVNLSGVTLPVWLDPGLAGIVLNLLAMTVGSALTRVSPEEEAMRKALHVLPESEKDPAERKKTLRTAKWGCLLGVFMAAMLVILWVIPYYQGLRGAG